MLSNRTLVIAGCALLVLLLIRQEIRMDQIQERLDDIIQVREQINYTKHDVDCLTRNIYYEAGVEDARGKYAVAHVTVNRLKTGYWGNSICKVVYAKSQFSWTLAKKLPKPDSQLWAESEVIARRVLSGSRVRGLVRSLYYHAVYIRDPVWADPSAELGQIGNHVFYSRAKGSNLTI
jgi:spore germination cell wall hydrolase CwlJ-like protein